MKGFKVVREYSNLAVVVLRKNMRLGTKPLPGARGGNVVVHGVRVLPRVQVASRGIVLFLAPSPFPSPPRGEFNK